MDTGLLIEKGLLILIVFSVTLLIATYLTYFERKIAAFLQDRLGPDRAGPFGIFQPIADAGKMFFKEEFIPAASNRLLFIIGPGIAMFTALMSSAIIPWGTTLAIFDRTIDLQVADLDIGILFLLGFLSIGVYGIMIGGWASNNKYSLFGAIRASSQMISYELAMGITIITIILMSGSLNLREIVEQQRDVWNVFYQPLGFLIFFTCALAETNRAPFDLPECETELAGGYHVEYSSMKLGFYLFAEYINLFISAAIIATLYFGGYNFPFMYSMGLPENAIAILSVLALFLKIAFFIFVFMWIRWTLPRFRYDQLMKLGWKVLIPLSILNMLATGGFLVLKDLF
jgi:NADH-quinone oxidoreductase subunit H